MAAPKSDAWLAVWTKPRAEKAVSRALAARGIVVWLPLARVARQWSDRVKHVELPLFPNYLFARVGPTEWSSLLHVSGVLTVVKSGSQPAWLRDRELDELRAAVGWIETAGEVPEVAHDFQPGDRVRVRTGPAAGLIGVLREVRGSRRLLIGLEDVGLALSVSLGVADVEPIAS